MWHMAQNRSRHMASFYCHMALSAGGRTNLKIVNLGFKELNMMLLPKDNSSGGPSIQVETIGKWVYKTDSFYNGPYVEILAKDNRNLVQSR